MPGAVPGDPGFMGGAQRSRRTWNPITRVHRFPSMASLALCLEQCHTQLWRDCSVQCRSTFTARCPQCSSHLSLRAGLLWHRQAGLSFSSQLGPFLPARPGAAKMLSSPWVHGPRRLPGRQVFCFLSCCCLFRISQVSSSVSSPPSHGVVCTNFIVWTLRSGLRGIYLREFPCVSSAARGLSKHAEEAPLHSIALKVLTQSACLALWL